MSNCQSIGQYKSRPTVALTDHIPKGRTTRHKASRLLALDVYCTEYSLCQIQKHNTKSQKEKEPQNKNFLTF